MAQKHSCARCGAARLTIGAMLIVPQAFESTLNPKALRGERGGEGTEMGHMIFITSHVPRLFSARRITDYGNTGGGVSGARVDPNFDPR